MTAPDVEEFGAEPVAQGAARALHVAAVVTLVLAALGLLPGMVGLVAGTAALAVVIAAPLLRVAWLAVRWWRSGDRHYALIAVALLAVVGAGVAAATIAA
jgi:hypothetical protein